MLTCFLALCTPLFRLSFLPYLLTYFPSLSNPFRPPYIQTISSFFKGVYITWPEKYILLGQRSIYPQKSKYFL